MRLILWHSYLIIFTYVKPREQKQCALVLISSYTFILEVLPLYVAHPIYLETIKQEQACSGSRSKENQWKLVEVKHCLTECNRKLKPGDKPKNRHCLYCHSGKHTLSEILCIQWIKTKNKESTH